MGLFGGQNSTYGYVDGIPLDGVDPMGLADVIVAVWRSCLSSGSVGHVATFDPAGNVLTSSFPIKTGIYANGSTLSWDNTVQREGRQPDDIYDVFVPDQDYLEDEYTAALYSSREKWFAVPLTENQTNCSRAASDTLKSSLKGENFLEKSWPNYFGNMIGGMAVTKGSGVTEINNVPWKK